MSGGGAERESWLREALVSIRKVAFAMVYQCGHPRGGCAKHCDPLVSIMKTIDAELAASDSPAAPVAVPATMRQELHGYVRSIIRGGMDADFHTDKILWICAALRSAAAVTPSAGDRAMATARAALERIAQGELNTAQGICNCTHDDENCCEVVGEFCPQCIAAVTLRALAMNAEAPQVRPKTAGELGK